MKIPKHYRQLKKDEIIRAGDLIFNKITYQITPIQKANVFNNLLVGGVVGDGMYFTMWRRRHVRVKKDNPVDNKPLVTFYYPASKEFGKMTWRKVRLIGMNTNYLVGLEISDNNHFKKFLRTKVDQFKFLEFNPQAVS